MTSITNRDEQPTIRESVVDRGRNSDIQKNIQLLTNL